MNNKLAIGLSIIGIVFLIFLLMNYSSSEMLQVADHTVEQRAIATIPESVMGSFRGKQFLLIEGDTIKVADANVFNHIFHSAAVQAQNRAAEKIVQESQNLQRQVSDAVQNINDYKSLIGPGINTVLGVPKNNRGSDLNSSTQDSNTRWGDHAIGGTSQRKQWGSHGILGDLYRYRGKRSANDASSRAWGNTWDDNSAAGAKYPCNTNQCNTYATANPGVNPSDRWSWERIKLRADDERPEWHN